MFDSSWLRFDKKLTVENIRKLKLKETTDKMPARSQLRPIPILQPFAHLTQRSYQWKEARATMLTASDFAAALGLSPSKSHKALWQQKVTSEEPAVSAYARRLMEPATINAYERAHNVTVQPMGLHVYPADPRLGGSSDGYIVQERMGIEVKVPRERPYDEVPLHYEIQMQGLMEVHDWDAMVFWVWTPIHGSKQWVVKRNKRLWQDFIYPKLVQFLDLVRMNTKPIRLSSKQKLIREFTSYFQ